jgi:hypothetical protein
VITKQAPSGPTTGIFCIESWSPRLTDRRTVHPLLDVLEQEAGINYIHRVADDREGLLYLLGRSGNYTRHRIVYLACHGARGAVEIGGSELPIAEVADDLPAGSLRTKTVYFGSCSTGGDRTSLAHFRERTGAEIVCGYADPKGADWLSAGAFELLLMRSLTQWSRGRTGLRHLRDEPASKSLWRSLSFVVEPASL